MFIILFIKIKLNIINFWCWKLENLIVWGVVFGKEYKGGF